MGSRLAQHRLARLLLFLFCIFSIDPARAERLSKSFTGVFCETMESYERSETSLYTLYENGSGLSRSNGKPTKLLFRNGTDKISQLGIQCGAQISFRGRLTNGSNRVVVEPETLALLSGSSGASGSGGIVIVPAPTPTPPGDQRALVILVDFQDSDVPCSSLDMESMVFSGASSVNAVYQDASKGTLSFSGKVSRYRISAQVAQGSCDEYEWAWAAEELAQNGGTNLARYPRRVFVLPSNTPCGWGGLGTVGGNPSRSWIRGCVAPTTVHELGHNLGMRHASQYHEDGNIEYGDRSDPLGNPSGLVGFNAAHKDQMGWAAPAEIAGNADITLSALNLDPASVPNPQVVKIIKPDSSNSDASDWYYLSYRNAAGFDALEPTGFFRNRLSIHTYKGGSINTVLRGYFPDNQIYTDSINDYTITMLSHDAATASVHLEFSPQPVDPVISISPWVLVGNHGVTKTYAVQITNMDHVSMDSSNFNLGVTAPSGWTTQLSSTSMLLDPRVTGSLTLDVTPPGNAPYDYNSLIFNLTDTAQPLHNSSPRFLYRIDNLAPLATVTSPADGSIVPSPSSSFSVRCQATDGIGLATGKIYINDVLRYSTNIDPNQLFNASWSRNFFGASLVVGPNSIRCEAADQAGNTASASVIISRQ